MHFRLDVMIRSVRSPSENGGEAVGLRVVPEEHHAVPRNAVVEVIPSVNFKTYLL